MIRQTNTTLNRAEWGDRRLPRWYPPLGIKNPVGWMAITRKGEIAGADVLQMTRKGPSVK